MYQKRNDKQEKPERPKLPTIDFRKIKRIRRIMNEFLMVDSVKYHGKVLDGTLLVTLSGIFAVLLSDSSHVVPRNNIITFLSAYVGNVIDRAMVSRWCNFITACYHEYQMGMVVTPAVNDGTIKTGHLLAKVFDIQAVKDASKGPCIRLKLRIVKGVWYGHTIYKDIPRASPYIFYLLKQAKINNRKRKTGTPRDLVNLYFFVKAESRGNTDFMLATDMALSPQLTARNYLLIKERRKPCIKGKSIACSMCNLGLEECFRATRPKTVQLTIESKVNTNVKP